MATSEALLTIPEVAAILAVSEDTVRRRITEREISHVRLRGLIRIQPSAVNEYIARMVVPAIQTRPLRQRSRRRAAVKPLEVFDDPLKVFRRQKAAGA